MFFAITALALNHAITPFRYVLVGIRYAKWGVMLNRVENFRTLKQVLLVALFAAGDLLALAPFSACATQSVTLAWNPSTNADIAGYNIYYGVASRAYTNQLSVGNVTTATISGLVEGVTYYFAAKAYNGSGVESDFSNEATYTVPGPANPQPMLNSINNITLYVNSSPQRVRLSGITSGSTNQVLNLTVSAVSDNSSLIPNPTVTYISPYSSGLLTLTPAANATGTATITVSVSEGQTQGSTVSQSFKVTVTDVNQRPTLDPIGDLGVDENSGPQVVNLSGITSGANYEFQTLKVTAVSSNPGLIPNPVVNYSSPFSVGSLIFTPATNAYGTATITVTVNDGQAQNNTVTQSFTVAVNPVNQPPTMDPINNLVVSENAAWQTVSLTGISSGASNEIQTLNISAVSSDPTIVPNPTVSYTSPHSTGTLSFVPVNGVSGAATITVTVNDNGMSNNVTVRTFSVAVLATSLPQGIALSPPQIKSQPTNSIAIAGQSVAFQVNASSLSGSSLVYQWQFNSVNLPFATNAVLLLTNVAPEDTGVYSVNISNNGGSTNSSPATLTVFNTTAATLGSAVRSNDGFGLTVNGVPGYKYAVQASTNMVDWVSLETNTAPFYFVDSNAGRFHKRFYRSVCLQ
jgi:Fibronectin type III domain/Immunoglobulin domain